MITADVWTISDLLRLSDAGFRCELVHGELRKMSPTGGRHGWATQRLHMELAPYIEAHRLGIILPAETGVDLTREGENARTVLAADITVVAMSQAEAINVDGYPGVVPLLVVETASPSQSRVEMDEKAHLWIERGVSEVWGVWPSRQELTVWRTGQTTPTTFKAGDQLSADHLFKGLVIDVTRVFRLPGTI